MKGIKVKNKCSKFPIIQGGMGVGVSLHKLAGSVAAEGGIGVISSADIGFKEPCFKNDPYTANQIALQHEIQLAKEISKDGIIGVNIMCVCSDYNETVRTAIKCGADLIISGAGLPMNLPELVNESNTAIAPIISSARALRLICRRWKKHYDRLPDIVIVEGPKAGGHLGFTFDELMDEKITLDKVVCDVLKLVGEIEKENNVEIPVIAAGGIYDSKDIQHYISLGASGVQMASRFVVTKECDADEEFKNSYIKATESDIEIIHSPVGLPGRAIRNPFIAGLKDKKEKVIHCTGCMKACQISKVPYCITEALIRSVKGNVDNGLIFCGSNVSKIKTMTTVHELFCELFPLEKDN